MTSGKPGLPFERLVPVRGLRLNIRVWPGKGRAFLLLHGLSSNARTWDGVARRLHADGYRVVAVDQRGHGLSDKPDDGYSFDDVTSDLRELIGGLGLARPILIGQSWGGNVVLDFAGRYPGLASGIVLVDGGFTELAARPDATWERISVVLRPPDLDGMPRREFEERLRKRHAYMTPERIEAVMGNFEVLADRTIRRRLSIPNHMKILRSVWEQRPSKIFGGVREPVLITAPVDADPERARRRLEAVESARSALARSRVRWFEDTVHDIHVQRPDELSAEILSALRDGFFGW
ncbi:MAG: alpha/beta hydrolase [Chloroflexi bacterium]|nr:alpha/beta hydrolase [Chloroflexota bacterium]